MEYLKHQLNERIFQFNNVYIVYSNSDDFQFENFRTITYSDFLADYFIEEPLDKDYSTEDSESLIRFLKDIQDEPLFLQYPEYIYYESTHIFWLILDLLKVIYEFSELEYLQSALKIVPLNEDDLEYLSEETGFHINHLICDSYG